MHTQKNQTYVSPLQQFGLYMSAALGVPVLFMSLGIISSEQLFFVLGGCFTLLGIA